MKNPVFTSGTDAAEPQKKKNKMKKKTTQTAHSVQ